MTNHVCQLDVGPDSGKHEVLWDAVGHGQEPTRKRERNMHRDQLPASGHVPAGIPTDELVEL